MGIRDIILKQYYLCFKINMRARLHPPAVTGEHHYDEQIDMR